MKEIKIRLNDEDYEIVKNINFSEIKNQVYFDDKKKEFKTSSSLAAIIFNEYIVTDGLDENYYPTDFGKKLYDLYDLIFLSEEI
jgi:hypothetical protein